IEDHDILPEVNHPEITSSPQPPSSSEPSLTVETSPVLNVIPETTELKVNGNTTSTVDLNGSAHNETILNSRPTIVGTEAKASTPQVATNSRSYSMDSVSDLTKSRTLKDQVLAKLPSVKNLVNLFSSNKDKDSNGLTSNSPVHSSPSIKSTQDKNSSSNVN